MQTDYANLIKPIGPIVQREPIGPIGTHKDFARPIGPIDQREPIGPIGTHKDFAREGIVVFF